MSLALVFSDAKCRFCQHSITRSIAHLFGNPADGYTCADCLWAERNSLGRLMTRLTEQCAKVIDLPGTPEPCIRCGTTGMEVMRLVHDAGEMGFLCLECEPHWLAKNKHQLGAKFVHDAKL